MTLTITPDPAQQIVPPDFDFTATWQNQSVITTAGTAGSPYVVDDATLVDESSAETRLEGPIFTEPPDAIENMQFSSDNPAVATVDAAGYVISITDGTTTVRCRRKHVLRKLTIAAAVEQTEMITKLQSYNNGTLGKHIKDTVSGLLSTSQQTNIYSSGTTRNPNVWTGAFDLTGVAYSNTTSGSAQRAGTLISPRHVVFVTHYKIAVGATITFVTSDGTLVTRTLAARQDVVASGDPAFASRDATIGRLDSDVPETIKWYKILGGDWQDYLTLYPNSDLPVIALDQERKALYRLRPLYPSPASDAVLRAFYNTVACSHSLAPQASENIISGDSGQPLFHPVNGELALIGCHTLPNSCWLLGAMKTEIDAAMTSLGGGYTSTEIDLTGFTNYG